MVIVADSILEQPIVTYGDRLVLGDQSGALYCFSSDGPLVWTPAKDLGSTPLSPLALTDGPARLLVATRNGTLYALADDGTTLWSGPVATGTTFRGSNISFPSAESPVTSTAYLSAANGKVYAVAVDGTLDTAAPWPKAFHDRRNTSNAGAAP